MLIKVFQYTAPLILAALVWILASLNRNFHLMAEFSVVGILNIAIAPMAELYYLWQRPTHYRYPVMISVSLLSFHASLGLGNYLTRTGAAESPAFGTFTMGQWMDGAVTIWAAAILILYFLRTYYKKPWRGVDGIKLGLVILLFGAFILGMVAKEWLLGLSGEADMVGIWLGVVILGSIVLFVLAHLIDVLFLSPSIPEMEEYEALINEINADESSAPDAEESSLPT